MIDEKFMRLAIDKAKEGISKGQKPFGACVVKDGVVISCSHNTEYETSDVTAHAEMNAIRESCKKLGSLDLSGCIIYATYKPCQMCQSACERAKIHKIVYGYSAERGPVEEYKIEIISNFLKSECLELIKSYNE